MQARVTVDRTIRDRGDYAEAYIVHGFTDTDMRFSGTIGYPVFGWLWRLSDGGKTSLRIVWRTPIPLGGLVYLSMRRDR